FGEYIMHDDDSGGNLNALMLYNVPMDGWYYILASQYWEGYGSYTLSVKTYESLSIQYIEAFPDDIFRHMVLQFLNQDGVYRTDWSYLNELDVVKLASISSLYLYHYGIADMTGLAYFSGLESLDCGANQLTALDVSQNPLLELLYCDDNYLTTLDISYNNNLSILWCYNNQLTELYLSEYPKLETIVCCNNSLTGLNVSNNLALLYLDCSENYMLTPDDVIGWRKIGLRLNDNFIFYQQKEIPQYYNFTASLESPRTYYFPGETVLVDLVLEGDINYTQIAAEIAFDTDLLEFVGYSYLTGWVANVSEVGLGNVAVRSMPTMNMVAGESCSQGVKIATLLFTVKEGIDAASVYTDLSFGSLLITPAGSVKEYTIAPGKPVTLSLWY
ncbi:MAG: hypothetical protein FWG43_05705, partial [Clostridiales bacterium]|nr:hypothetical protein [Clostridiales bacterium]